MGLGFDDSVTTKFGRRLDLARRLVAEVRREQETALFGTVESILKAASEVELPDVELSAYLVSVFFEGLIDDYLLRQSDSPRFDRDRVPSTRGR